MVSGSAYVMLSQTWKPTTSAARHACPQPAAWQAENRELKLKTGGETNESEDDALLAQVRTPAHDLRRPIVIARSPMERST